MEKIFAVIKVLQEKRVNIGMFYLTGEADIWWSNVKDRLVGPELTWNKFLEELRAKFYSITVRWQKENEFSKLRMTSSMTVM